MKEENISVPRQEIVVKNAREHNLKNISLTLPKNKLIVITGPSGSGKSSLAFDTLYAEGQRRYVESLSSYARQFLGVQKKPDVDDIEGLSPAISIEQKGTSHNPRSTVGTVTEIYDFLRLLFARAGTPYCPKCGKPVHRYSVDEIVDRIYKEHSGARLEIMAPVVRAKKGEFKNIFAALRKKGFMRVRVDGEILWLEEDIPLEKNKKHSIEVVVDRMSVQPDRKGRIAEAVQTALQLGEGFVLVAADGVEDMLTERFVCPDCGISLPDIQPALFSFNNPQGACPDCSGLGSH
ncbi:MAG: ATP-binding cassette domain-containing protein, partial [Pyramidobacter sp.]|nr:ATP-binding cassette domain-containing protein [Pyramidobacter sp.]